MSIPERVSSTDPGVPFAHMHGLTPSLRPRHFVLGNSSRSAPKGRDMPAQGNALGMRPHCIKP